MAYLDIWGIEPGRISGGACPSGPRELMSSLSSTVFSVETIRLEVMVILWRGTEIIRTIKLSCGVFVGRFVSKLLAVSLFAQLVDRVSNLSLKFPASLQPACLTSPASKQASKQAYLYIYISAVPCSFQFTTHVYSEAAFQALWRMGFSC